MIKTFAGHHVKVDEGLITIELLPVRYRQQFFYDL